jgi:hypothetical protein
LIEQVPARVEEKKQTRETPRTGKSVDASTLGSWRLTKTPAVYAGLSSFLVSHLIANWNPLLNWLEEVNLLKETIPAEGLGALNHQIQANSPVPN